MFTLTYDKNFGTWKILPDYRKKKFSSIKTLTQFIRRNNIKYYQTYYDLKPYVMYENIIFTDNKIIELIHKFKSMHKN
jgi:hypothetical protein